MNRSTVNLLGNMTRIIPQSQQSLNDSFSNVLGTDQAQNFTLNFVDLRFSFSIGLAIIITLLKNCVTTQVSYRLAKGEETR